MHFPHRIFRPALVLIAVLALLAGCTRSSAPAQPTTGASGQPVAADPPPAAENRLFTLGVGDEPSGLHNQLAEAIERRFPGVTVRTIRPQFVANQGVDIAGWLRDSDLALGDPVSPEEYPLQDLSALELPELDPAIAPFFAEVSRHQGRRYAVPFVLQPDVLYMNLNRLEADGIAPPPPDWTLAEFEAILAELAEWGHPPFPISPLFGDLLDPVLRSFGGQVQDPETGDWTLDTPEARQALTWLARMVQGGMLQPRWTSGEAFELNLPSGQAFHYTSFTWGIPPLDVALQPFPAGPRGRFTPLVAHVGVIPAESRHPELAREILVSLVADPEFRLILARQGARPLVADAAAMTVWRQALGEGNAQAVEMGLEGAYMHWWVDPSYRAIKALTPYLTGETDLESVLSELPPARVPKAQGP